MTQSKSVYPPTIEIFLRFSPSVFNKVIECPFSPHKSLKIYVSKPSVVPLYKRFAPFASGISFNIMSYKLFSFIIIEKNGNSIFF